MLFAFLLYSPFAWLVWLLVCLLACLTVCLYVCCWFCSHTIQMNIRNYVKTSINEFNENGTENEQHTGKINVKWIGNMENLGTNKKQNRTKFFLHFDNTKNNRNKTKFEICMLYRINIAFIICLCFQNIEYEDVWRW